jgi:tetratricopeptide (TPR) repeat protein
MSAPAKSAQAAAAAKSHVAAGRELLKRDLLDEAEREFRLAIEADANDLEAVAGLGQVEVARGQYSEGMAHLERATRGLGQMVSALRSLGDAYSATGDMTRAASAYRQAVALAPADIDLRLALVRSLTEIGEYAEARAVCSDAIRLAKGNSATLSQAYRQMGEVYSREGNTPEAFAALYKAAELDRGIPKSRRASPPAP